MPDLSEFFDSGKKLLIITGALVAVFVAGIFGLKAYRSITADKTPIISISAKNDKIYSVTDKIKTSDFTITAKHKDGGTSVFAGDDTVKLSRSHVPSYGKYADVKLTTKSGLACTAKVKCERNKIISFNCAKHKKDNVKATLYSNGELAFEGNGELAGFANHQGPWFGDYDSKGVKITSVTFGKGVKVIDGTSLFNNIQNLRYVGSLPSTLVSANSMFSGCVNLKRVPDMSKCAVLKDMTSAFSGCTSLTGAGTVPASAVTVKDMFNGCTSLEKAAVFASGAQATDASEMYSGCTSLTDPGHMPSKINIMSSTYQGCINLAKMPNIPKGTSDISSAFSNCKLLKRFSAIPSSVKKMSGCFSGCTYMSGTVRIDANAEEYGGLFSEAATATKINLVGKSKLLHYYAYTSENPKGHIYVRGHAAVKPKDMY